MNFDEAISVHARCKMRLRIFLSSGKSDPFDPGSAHLDDQCEVGQWIRHEGLAEMIGEPDFTDLATVHTAFHCHIGEIVRAAECSPAKARLLLEGDTFLGLSMELISCLHRLKKKYATMA